MHLPVTEQDVGSILCYRHYSYYRLIKLELEEAWLATFTSIGVHPFPPPSPSPPDPFPYRINQFSTPSWERCPFVLLVKV